VEGEDVVPPDRGCLGVEVCHGHLCK
jgi:hypothetical protein